jgi:hypothetical protein
LTAALPVDLRTLILPATEVSTGWVMIQTVRALHDESLLARLRECHEEIEPQVKCLTTRLKQAAPQELVVG